MQEDLYATEEEPVSSSALAADAAFCLPLHAAEDAPAAQEASPLTVFTAGPPPAHLTHCHRRQLPPFPSSHASPYVLCQHCFQLLLLPQAVILFPPSGSLLLHSFLLIKLKCGYCLKISKFSARHLRRASSSSLPQRTCFPAPPLRTSMPSCITSNGVLQVSERNYNVAEEPLLNAALYKSALKSDTVVLTNGSVEDNSKLKLFETGAPLHVDHKRTPNVNHIKNSESLNGIHKDSSQFKVVATRTLGNAECVHIQEDVLRTGESLSGICGDMPQSKNVGTVAIQNGACVHSQEIVIETEPLNGPCELTAQSKHDSDAAQLKSVEAGEIHNGLYVHSEKIVIKAEPLNGSCEKAPQSKHVQTELSLRDKCDNAQEIASETMESLSANCRQPAKNADNEAGLNFVCEKTPSQEEISELGVRDNGAMHDMHSNKEQEIAAFSSAQDWVDSLSVEIGYESDNQGEGHLNCPNDCREGLKRFASSRHRSPLHRHFGYGSPSELFEKVLFSEDEEIKARSETNSTASSSFSSISASRPTQTKSRSVHVHALSLRSWSLTPDVSGVIDATDLDARRSLAGLLRKALKRGSLLPASPKSKVVVNGHTLSTAAVKQAEERAGKLRPGSYWYDYKAGFWGVEGGPCLGILPPYIEALNYPMTNQCSNGDTQVYVNGRELHAKDLALLSQRGLSKKTGRAYALGFDGVLIDETTGLELKHLGKLAPTVQQRGKGFGMFTADVLHSKAGATHQIKLSNSVQ